MKGLLSGSTKAYAWEEHVGFVGETHKIDYNLHKELRELNEGSREGVSLTSKSIGSDSCRPSATSFDAPANWR